MNKSFSRAVIASMFMMLIASIVISCAGTAGGIGGGSDTALSVSLPDNRALWSKSEVQFFTVTISSSSYKETKSAAGGETITFSSIPVGIYNVNAIGKNSKGDITAKGTTTVEIIEGENTSTTVVLKRLECCTVTFHSKDASGNSIVYATKTVTQGYTVVASAGANVGGQTFSFWTDTDGGTTPFDFTTPISSDIDLYAAWNRVLTSISVSGSLPSSQMENVALDRTGITVTANFDNGTTADVTNDANTTYILAGGDNTKFTQIGSQPVKVSYTYEGVEKIATVGTVSVKFTPQTSPWTTPVLSIDKSSVSTNTENFTLSMTTSYVDKVHTRYNEGGGETVKEVMAGEVCFWTVNSLGSEVYGFTGYGESIYGESGSVDITVSDILTRSANNPFSCVKFYLNCEWALIDSSNNKISSTTDYCISPTLFVQTSTGEGAPSVNYAP